MDSSDQGKRAKAVLNNTRLSDGITSGGITSNSVATSWRVFLPEAPIAGWCVGAVATLSSSDSSHLGTVLRLHVGDSVTAICAKTQQEFDASIQEISPVVRLVLNRPLTRVLRVMRQDTLVVPLLKGDRLDWLVEKGTELGLGAINIYEATRSVAKLPAKSKSLKLERWLRIAEAAAKQCARTSIPDIQAFNSLHLALAQHSVGLFGSLAPGTPLLNELPAMRDALALVVGPEGDFTPEELKLLSSRQFLPVSLGSLVLRAETAAMVLVASVNALWCPNEMP